MAKPYYITHPQTGETYCKAEWARRIGRTTRALSDRIEKHGTIIALTPGPLPLSKHIWSQEEDDYLELVYKIPNLYKLWNQSALKRGWKCRSQKAISERIRFLQNKGILNSRRGIEESDGWLTMCQLAECMGVSSDSVRRWIAEGLRVDRTSDCLRSHYKIHLKDFVTWACTVDGATLIAKAIEQNAIASIWLLVQIGNWMPEVGKKRHDRT